jgi:hypothetical protein
VQISVSDGQIAASLPSFTIRVNAAAQAPEVCQYDGSLTADDPACVPPPPPPPEPCEYDDALTAGDPACVPPAPVRSRSYRT